MNKDVGYTHTHTHTHIQRNIIKNKKEGNPVICDNLDET